MDIETIEAPGGRLIARRCRPGRGPAILFLPGYASDMLGTKAAALDVWAERSGRAFCRFDYSGTGESPGDFAEGTLLRWLEDAEAVAKSLHGPLLVVGSSMGGWLMLLLARRLGPRVAGLVGIAAAPDFTDWGFGPEERAILAREGRLVRGDPSVRANVTTQAFWQSGQEHLLLGSPIAFEGPVRLLHGARDDSVPLGVAHRLANALTSEDVTLTILKSGDHRLSRPSDIDLLLRTVGDLCDALEGAT